MTSEHINAAIALARGIALMLFWIAFGALCAAFIVSVIRNFTR